MSDGSESVAIKEESVEEEEGTQGSGVKVKLLEGEEGIRMP